MKLFWFCHTSLMTVFTIVILLSSVGAGLADTTSSVSFRPYKISYGHLMDDTIFQDQGSAVSKLFKDALYTVGMVTITDVFTNGSGTNEESVHDDSKRQTLGSLHQCLMDSDLSKAQTYHDSSLVRNTLATVTIPSQNLQMPMFDNTTMFPLPSSCDVFTSSSRIFRSRVTEVTKVLTERVLTLLSGLVDANVHDTLKDVLSKGEHLEHFHSYQYTEPTRKTSATTTNPSYDVDDESTIHWHTDQGLFLMFTPARTVQPSQTKDEVHGFDSSVMKEGLYIQLLDGMIARVDFDENDDLVFMLGDGINQYINPRLDNDSTTDPSLKLFRATPHTLMIQPSKKALMDDEVRVWYGRMVLPSTDAKMEQNSMTFGELRTSMIDATLHHLSSIEENDGNIGPLLSVGCSSGYVARDLAAAKCKSGTMYCWHSCVKFSAAQAARCKATKKVLGCGNKNGKWWDNSHGDWYPTCLNPKTKPKGYPYL